MIMTRRHAPFARVELRHRPAFSQFNTQCEPGDHNGLHDQLQPPAARTHDDSDHGPDRPGFAAQ